MGLDVPCPTVKSVLDGADAFRYLLDRRLLGWNTTDEKEAIRTQLVERLEEFLVRLEIPAIVHPQHLVLHQRLVPQDLRAVVEPAADDVAALRVPPQELRGVERSVVCSLEGVMPGNVRLRVPGYAQRPVRQRHDVERPDIG